MADSQDIYTTADMLGRMPSRSPMKDLHGYVTDYLRKRDEVPNGALAAALEEGPPKQQEPNWFGNYVLGPMGKVAEAMPGNSFDLATGVLFPGGKVRLPPGKAPIRAYHGSPHDFDRFDASKIGTGEGAQAYGHGLYFAEAEPVAKSYRDMVKPSWHVDTDPFNPGGYLGMVLDHSTMPHARKEFATRAEAEAWARAEADKIGSPGKMYEVALHATPEQFLDWDKPLSGQPQQDAIRRLAEQAYPEAIKAAGGIEPVVGSSSVGGFMNQLGRENAANALREAGIPGIRYKDQVSRGTPADLQQELATWERSLAGAQARKDPGDIAKFSERVQEARDRLSGKIGGTSNYVVFPGSEGIVEILRKYGILAPVAAPTLASVLASPDQQ